MTCSGTQPLPGFGDESRKRTLISASLDSIPTMLMTFPEALWPPGCPELVSPALGASGLHQLLSHHSLPRKDAADGGDAHPWLGTS